VSWLSFGSLILAQKAPDTQHYVLTPSAGVKIDIAVDGPANAETLAQQLEDAARRLREAARQENPTPEAPPPDRRSPPVTETAPAPGVGDGAEPGWGTLTLLPTTLLWDPPIASHWSPRMFVLPTTLNNPNTRNTIDTAIGGTVAVSRWNPNPDPHEAVQLDVFAVVFSRFAEGREAVAQDYRFGFPLTFAWGAWSGQVAFEHTSTHLGDEFIGATGRQHQPSQRNEVTVGLSYTFCDELRLYTQSGFAFILTNPTGNARRDRWDLGVEWNRTAATGWWGYPFAAFDVEFRGDENYRTNLTVEAGWQWRGYDRGPTSRVGLEYYDGQSPFGQFIADKERWFGLFLSYDF
jgi:hypothetical protein